MDEAAFRKAVAAIAGTDPSADRATVEADLRAREARLSRTIHDATGDVALLGFVRVEDTAPRRWVVHVPVYTDIEDAESLQSFESAVENVWRLRDAQAEFRVDVEITRLTAVRLYGSRPPPGRRTRIDLHAHLALFPPDGAVITTGGALTHVTEGHCIVLGPHAIARHVLAHEFGHVLGFRDVYLRGYRDLGADGYEVTEVVADPDDIMGAPGSGPVVRRHFEELIRRSGAPEHGRPDSPR